MAVLQRYEMTDCAEVIAKSQIAGRLNAGKNAVSMGHGYILTIVISDDNSILKQIAIIILILSSLSQDKHIEGCL